MFSKSLQIDNKKNDKEPSQVTTLPPEIVKAIQNCDPKKIKPATVFFSSTSLGSGAKVCKGGKIFTFKSSVSK